MTIGIQITTGPHKARISRTGHNDLVIGPNANQHFAAYPGMVVTVTEEAADGAGTVHADSGGNGPPPTPPTPPKPSGN